MNILFLMKNYDVGGVEIVTNALGTEFVKRGHRVYIASFMKPSSIMLERTFSSIRYYQLNGYNSSKTNVNLLYNIILNQNIDVVINQWGLPFIPIEVLKKVRKRVRLKIISVHHNDPSTNGKLKRIEELLANERRGVNRFVLKSKWMLFRIITGLSMRYVYANSDYYILLSSSFIGKFKQFVGVNKSNKLLIQTNPVTIDVSNFNFNLGEKRKEIIYVGRIDHNQKRVCRVVETWALLEKKCPNWSLTIIGDGTEKAKLQKLAHDLGIERIMFDGFQEPKCYYERASILILTSEYEGFPLVLAECMSFGVVPVVYGSYSAVYDIISDGSDGLILPYDRNGFKAEAMAEKLLTLMGDDDYRISIAQKAVEKSKKYSIRSIVDSWENLFSKL